MGEVVDAKTKRWSKVPDKNSKMCRLGMATLNGKICGGYYRSSFVRSVEVFESVQNKWSYIKNINVTCS